MKSNCRFKSTFTQILLNNCLFLLLFASLTSSYHLCHSRGLVVWLSTNGYCHQNCEQLQNCTTLKGNVVLRQSFTFTSKTEDTRLPQFPKLTEITGYMIVFLLGNRKDLSVIFPNLAVIRGQQLFMNYALVVYKTKLQQINLPSLTAISRGGIRIEGNMKLCYVKTIRWESISAQGNSNYDESSIWLSDNNDNCYDRCLSQRCQTISGHGKPGSQYCWGPGSQSNSQCQRLCDKKCGDSGCVHGNPSKCCHSNCLGGCSQSNSTFHCAACKYFRDGSYGSCVSKCPVGKYQVDKFNCQSTCPSWHIPIELAKQFNFPMHYISNGACVLKCPAGFTKDDKSRSCVKCQASKCPKVCKMYGVISSISAIAQYTGCTEIDGSLSIQLRGRSGNIADELEKGLGQIEVVHGYIEIRESTPLKTLSFLSNLKRIDASQEKLASDKYAFVLYDNSNLESLWTFKHNITVPNGKLFFHLNPRLCTGNIRKLQTAIGHNQTDDDISESTNGISISCVVVKINVTAKEVTNQGDCLGSKKCIHVSWEHSRDLDDRKLLFYSLSFRIVPDRNVTEQDDVSVCSQNLVWERKDVFLPEYKPNVTSKTILDVVVSGLKPFKLYAMYVEAVVREGAGRKSDMVFIQVTPALPSPPVALEANFLSPSKIQLKWKAPDDPNGNVLKYKIYVSKSNYSFWKDNLDWCSRELDLTTKKGQPTSTGENNVSPDGQCYRNLTCDCSKEDKDSIATILSRNKVSFAKEFEDSFLNLIFVKPKQNNSEERVATTTPTPENCEQNSTDPACTSSPIPTIPITTAINMISSVSNKKELKTIPPTDAPIENQSSSSNIMSDHVEMYSVDGKSLEHVLEGLDYFQDYSVVVCACSQAGCPEPYLAVSKCATLTATTDVNATADQLHGNLTVSVSSYTFNISWYPPQRPNGVVLKYDVAIRNGLNEERLNCHPGIRSPYFISSGSPGNYTARIRAITPAGNGSWSKLAVFEVKEFVSEEPGSGSSSLPSVVIGVSVAAAIIIIILIIFVIYYAFVKRTTDGGVPGVLYASVNPEYLNSDEVYIADEWEVPRDKIDVARELGQGAFGMVYEGIAYDVCLGNPKCLVAIKTVNENASIRDRIEFLKEASNMKGFQCHHVVRLLGVVSIGQPTFVIMELMERGDLKSHLKKRRPEERGPLLPPNQEEYLQMAAEIADGMSYLASKHFVHRDLAARNCMVGADFTVKVGDFGMARDIYETDYYRKGGKGLLPVRWMAPESLKDGVFTTLTDVWSFGVVLWEMATLGAQPYPGKSNEEVLRFVVGGGILDKAENVPPRLHELMSKCWRFSPKERPTFRDILRSLENDVHEDFIQRSFYHEQLELNRSTHKLSRDFDEQCATTDTGNDRSSAESSLSESWKPEADRSVEKRNFPHDLMRTKSVYDNDGNISLEMTPPVLHKRSTMYESRRNSDASEVSSDKSLDGPPLEYAVAV